eukprot:gnl/TRDRNA2_/TRDRNA2_172641_c0_seq1.p1 gnl/TRDRNA2_/TRDRNA2_172641_c0~~gnl/TRDRNA2_/TRDRNA2_172641_c0_seq1.p1  ORF type:complete len:115 (+),score=11.12 gnl/TRDRNA2_/TRDRNA2_172641_c0_seq1:34-378(+)
MSCVPHACLLCRSRPFPASSFCQEVIGTSFDTVVPFGFATPDYTSPYFCLLAHGEGSHCPQSASCAEQLLRPGVLAGTPPRFYSAEMHAASFVLPASIADIAASRDDCDDDEAA